MKRFLIITTLVGVMGQLLGNDVAVDQANFLAKVDVEHLLDGKDGALYAEQVGLAKDLQISEIADFFGCQTLSGRNYLERSLNLPISPKSICGTVEKRQKLIRALVNDPELKAKVDVLLAEAKAAEQTVVELFSVAFRSEFCPEEKQLELLRQMNHPYYGFNKYLFKNPVGRMVKSGVEVFNVASNTGLAVFYNKYDMKGMAVFHAALAGFSAYSFAQDYKSGLAKRNKLHALTEIIKVAADLELLCAENNLDTQFSCSQMIENSDLKNVIDELKRTRYTQKTSYAFAFPLVHSFLYDIYEKEKCLAGLFASIAEIDSCNAIATKMLEQQDKGNQFCFVNFIDQNRPEFRAKKLWNVLVGAEKAVANDLAEVRNVILSGNNAGGKTTLIRAILQNIVLGQTYGVAAAEEFNFTQFDVVHSYLNISDNLTGHKSLFDAEVSRAQDINNKMNSLAPDAKYFFALDELFTATAAAQGAECAKAFVQNLSDNVQTQFIYATHFDGLKQMVDGMSNCANYHVDSVPKLADGSRARRVDGRLAYPYTVSAGASYDNVALEIADDAGLFGNKKPATAAAA